MAKRTDNFRAAQAAYPISAEVSWKYGNFLLRQNRLPEAYAEIHRAVMVDPKLIPLAVSRVGTAIRTFTCCSIKFCPTRLRPIRRRSLFWSMRRIPTAALEVWHRLIAKDPQAGFEMG